MQKMLIALTGAAMLILGGCQATAPVKEEAPAPQAAAPQAEVKPSLTDEAKATLAQAEADVKGAKAKKALWTTAEDALKKAQEAANEFDSKAVIKHAKTASDHVRMGLEQAKYPMTNK